MWIIRRNAIFGPEGTSKRERERDDSAGSPSATTIQAPKAGHSNGALQGDHGGQRLGLVYFNLVAQVFCSFCPICSYP